jgi:deoxyuridine 5'-triphosphate nucleotidohydrolase
LEIVVLPEAAQFYPAVGTVENLTDDNAGYDVKIVNKEVPRPVAALAPLGIKARMIKCTVLPNGERLEQGSHYTLEPRSSIFKTSFVMANSRGIIDKSYRGELKAPMVSVGSNLASVDAGTRLFQILAPNLGYINQVVYVESLDETSRGSGGFGSTGTK